MLSLRDNRVNLDSGDAIWERQETKSWLNTDNTFNNLNEFFNHLRSNGHEARKAMNSVPPRTAPELMDGIQLDIWKGRLENHELVCLKVLRVYTEGFDKKKLLKQLGNEVLIWRQLQHSNIQQFLGIANELFQPSYCIVSPWMANGNVMTYCRRHNSNFDVKMTMIKEICEGVRYLHEYNPPIVHSDIKGMNVLVCDEGHCRISDFGLCTIEDDSPAGRVSESTSQAAMRGSVPWLAPELMNPGCVESPNRTTRDIYALGCTMYEIFTGIPPFSDRKMDLQIVLAVLNGIRPPRPAECPDQLWMIIERCWSEESRSRLIASQVAALLVETTLTSLSAPSNISVVNTKGVEHIRRVKEVESLPEGSPSRTKPLLPTGSIPRRQDEVFLLRSSRKRNTGDVDSPVELEPLAKRRLSSPLGGTGERWDVTVRDVVTEQKRHGVDHRQAHLDSNWTGSEDGVSSIPLSARNPESIRTRSPLDSESDDVVEGFNSDEDDNMDNNKGKTKREHLPRAFRPDEHNELKSEYQGDEPPPPVPDPEQNIDFFSSRSEGTQENDDLLELLGLRPVVPMSSISYTTHTRGSAEWLPPHGQSDDVVDDVAGSSNLLSADAANPPRFDVTSRPTQTHKKESKNHALTLGHRKREHLPPEIQKQAETIEKLVAQLAEEEKSEQNLPRPDSSTSGDVFGLSSPSDSPPYSGSPLDEPSNEMSGEENRVVEDWIIRERESWAEFSDSMGVGRGTLKRHIGEGALDDSSSEDEAVSVQDDDDEDTDAYELAYSLLPDSASRRSQGRRRRSTWSYCAASPPQPSRYAKLPTIPDEAAPFGLMARMSVSSGRKRSTYSSGSDTMQDTVWDDISVQDAWKRFRGRVGTSELVGVPPALQV
ncbi:Homeobox protein tos8 [Marasmius sp. AFHP31]|nr:Homeobox protein tos8 [Marasmius sp. AFHP31]